MDQEKCYGTCKRHCRDYVDDEYACVNIESPYWPLWTEYSDCCDEWEVR